jgi:cardiolipin synthase
VGTVNMDYRSLYLHLECGVCLYGSSAIGEIERDFLATQARSREITLADCKTNPFIRLMQQICRVFAPLM